MNNKSIQLNRKWDDGILLNRRNNYKWILDKSPSTMYEELVRGFKEYSTTGDYMLVNKKHTYTSK